MTTIASTHSTTATATATSANTAPAAGDGGAAALPAPRTAAAASAAATAAAGGRAARRTPPPPRPGVPSRPGTRRDSRRPGGPRTPQTAHRLPQGAARRRAAERLPHRWFADQLVLTLSGRRPVHALLGHALPAAYDRLVELAPQTPLRPAGPYHRAPEPQVRECGVYCPRRGVIEAFARISAGERVRALAFRLERGRDARWRCAALDIGPSLTVWDRTT
ncbi:Rv3235 family protein [Streptomyces sclerotialus]|uniref:Rv3235 family protein n=1 Tax=Streptomyces sclerotialus TaxID=1957 RepID=UPI0004C6B4A8